MLQPFFIVGVGRVGSTMLYRILGRHPRVALTNEGRIADFFVWASAYAAVPRGSDFTYPLNKEYTLAGIVSPDEVEHFDRFFRGVAPRLVEDWYRERFADREFTHWGDKLPLALTPAALQSVYPHARFVVLVRDPRDFVCSLFAHADRLGDAIMDPVERDVPAHATAWRTRYDGYLTFLRHHLIVRYEDVVADTDAEVRRILEFLDLDTGFDLRSEDDEKHRRNHGTTSSARASVERWRRDLSADDLESIESICGDLMAQLGYRLSTET